MENDTIILLLITSLLIIYVTYNHFQNKVDVKENIAIIDDNSINKKDLYKYNKIYRKNICLDKKNNKKKKYNKILTNKKIEIVENDIDSLDNLLNNKKDMISLNSIDNNTLSDIETFV